MKVNGGEEGIRTLPITPNPTASAMNRFGISRILRDFPVKSARQC